MQIESKDFTRDFFLHRVQIEFEFDVGIKEKKIHRIRIVNYLSRIDNSSLSVVFVSPHREMEIVKIESEEKNCTKNMYFTRFFSQFFSLVQIE